MIVEISEQIKHNKLNPSSKTHMIAKLSYEGEINPHEYASILEDFQIINPQGMKELLLLLKLSLWRFETIRL